MNEWAHVAQNNKTEETKNKQNTSVKCLSTRLLVFYMYSKFSSFTNIRPLQITTCM